MNDLFEKPITLSDRELLEDIHRMLVTLTDPVSKPKPKRVPKARHVYDEAFETLWRAYPARNGSNPKWKAQQAWRARRKDSEFPGTTEMEMLEGVKLYSTWCEATAKTGTEMVMQTARFLGPSKEYANAWEIPAPEVEVVKLPRDNNELVAFAAKLGLQPNPGEDWWEFRRRVEDAL